MAVSPGSNSSEATYFHGRIFDGKVIHADHTARFEHGSLTNIHPYAKAPQDGHHIDLGDDILCPGYVDLQVNGGGGVLFNDDPSVDTLHRIAAAHYRLGTTQLLPTLITDTPQKTSSAIQAATDAMTQVVPGIAGLHLEGPHLSVAKCGAHDPALIRPMRDADLAELISAAQVLPVLMVTLAPESVSLGQVEVLAHAGVIVSLGHSNADFETCLQYAKAGALCTTHLFNAMSQLGSRDPGLVGAALHCGGLSAGLIADGIHVHPAAIRAAWVAKRGPGAIFLVSDAMAVAGTNLTGFTLQEREILRRNNRLTLSDGTLAGADLNLTTAVRMLVECSATDLETALAAATSVPEQVAGIRRGADTILHRQTREFIRIRADLSEATPLIPPAL